MAQAEEIRTETGPLDYDYTEKEVELCQENLQNHKACSPDKIKNEMLKGPARNLKSWLTCLAITYSDCTSPNRVQAVQGQGRRQKACLLRNCMVMPAHTVKVSRKW
eukprot:g82097.t1